jgi:hypothetical protein
MPSDINDMEFPPMSTRQRERAMGAIEEQLRRSAPSVTELDKLFDTLAETATTESECNFIDRLRTDAKKLVGSTLPDSAVEEQGREILRQLEWVYLRGTLGSVDHT